MDIPDEHSECTSKVANALDYSLPGNKQARFFDFDNLCDIDSGSDDA